MKKSIVVFMILAVLVVFPIVAFGKSSKAKSVKPAGEYLHKGDLAVLGGIGLGYYGSVTIYPGAEYMVYETDLTDFLPIRVGVAGRGFLNFYSYTDAWGTYGWTAFGLGAFGTFHYAFKSKELNLPKFFDRLDFYVGLGLAYSNFKLTGDWGILNPYVSSGGAFGFASYGGFNYFITNNIAVFLEGNYWSYAGGTIGVYFKL